MADGKVKVANGGVDKVTADGLVLSSGVELKADVIIMATGYGSMNEWAASLISQEVVLKVS